MKRVGQMTVLDGGKTEKGTGRRKVEKVTEWVRKE